MMDHKSFIGGLALGLVATAGVWVSKRMDDQIASGPDRRWALPGYDYQEWPHDDPQTIFVTGTLQGKGVGYPVNTWSLRCARDERVCHVASASEIGRDQLGSVDTGDWPIITWTGNIIVAQDDPADTTACARATITIYRESKSVNYTSVPTNTNKDYCKKFHQPNTYDLRIGPPVQPWEKLKT